ncbi:hypothetical protein C8Q76DRAFT_800761 [Earliella scabrosa]|nr:hypothetical protein C8Q76DRAFT_800761 [Earliella scabrosa]
MARVRSQRRAAPVVSQYRLRSQTRSQAAAAPEAALPRAPPEQSDPQQHPAPSRSAASTPLRPRKSTRAAKSTAASKSTRARKPTRAGKTSSTAGKKGHKVAGEDSSSTPVSLPENRPLSPPRVAPNPNHSRSAAKQRRQFNLTGDLVERHARTLDHDTAVDDLSDLSDTEKSSRWGRRTEPTKLKFILGGLSRLAANHIRQSQTRSATYVLEHFNLREAINRAQEDPNNVKCVETRVTRLLGDKGPERVVCAGGYQILVLVPGAFKDKNLEDLTSSCYRYGGMCDLRTDLANDKKGSYKTGGSLVGSAVLATTFTAIGHGCSKDPMTQAGPNAGMRKTNATFNAACELLEKLQGPTSYVMSALRTLDPIQYDLVQKVYQFRQENIPSARALAKIDAGMFYEGREIQFNRYSLPHYDSGDPHLAWALSLYFGTFGKCVIKFPQIAVEVTVRPGDFCAWRGRDLVHCAETWEEGERCLLVHFTHKALWDAAAVTCDTGKAVWHTPDPRAAK